MDLRRLIQGAATSERVRRRMALRGVTPNGHRLWDQFEAGTLRLRYPGYRRVLKVVHRTLPGAYSKAGRMRITKTKPPAWTENEIFRLRIYRTGTKAEILAAFPGRSFAAIARKANSRGIYRARPAPNTGNRLLDQILQRARDLNMTLADLDGAAQAGTYFSHRKWKRLPLRLHFCARAVAALGGQTKIRWQDDQEE